MNTTVSRIQLSMREPEGIDSRRELVGGLRRRWGDAGGNVTSCSMLKCSISLHSTFIRVN